MRFIVDQCVSPLVAQGLRQLGHEAVHVSDLGLAEADDAIILSRASHDAGIVITADHDYPLLLARSGDSTPSVILLKEDAPAAAAEIVQLLARNLPQLTAALSEGCIAVIHADRMRIRRLPIR